MAIFDGFKTGQISGSIMFREGDDPETYYASGRLIDLPLTWENTRMFITQYGDPRSTLDSKTEILSFGRPISELNATHEDEIDNEIVIDGHFRYP